MRMNRRNWTREELMLALNLYLKLPFGKMHSRTPEVIHLAKIIDRTPSSIAMRLVNFASVDPFHQNRGVGGLPGGKKQVEPIWQEFLDNKDNFLFESENILADKESNSIDSKYADILTGTENLVGDSRIREVKVRVNQNVFRQIVLANYSSKCAISGIDIPELLVASHIVPWSKNETERLNPENGICLSSMYDKAFDKGLIGLNFDYSILISERIKQNSSKTYYQQYFAHLENKKINLPPKYYPKKDFIQFHLDSIFQS
jgi:putative restriction endonuclease